MLQKSTHSVSLTSFKSYLPVLAVKIWADVVPEDVGSVGKREGVQEQRHGQRGQLAKLWLQHGPQTETQTQVNSIGHVSQQLWTNIPVHLLLFSFLFFFLTEKISCENTPRDKHLLLDVGQKLGVILAGEVQTLSMETQDLQTVQHVKQDVRLLELGHFLWSRKRLIHSVAHVQNADKETVQILPDLSGRTYLKDCVNELQRHGQLLVGELLIGVILHGCMEKDSTV